MTTETIPGRFRVRNDTAAKWMVKNPTLLQGEWGLERDTRRLKMGDGVNPWNLLDYFAGGSSGGPSGGSGGFTHYQPTAASQWIVNHNLGFRPSVEIMDSASQEIEGDVFHPSPNQTIINLNPATAGLARFS